MTVTSLCVCDDPHVVLFLTLQVKALCRTSSGMCVT